MGILSIQSSVAAGHVGNAAAVFPLQRLGFDVWRVDTVVFSNHPAHGRHKGRIVGAGEVETLLDGLADLGLWDQCEAVMSGYLGSAETGAVIAETVARIRAARPDMLYLCDPVIGDDGKVYVGEGIVDFYRNAGIPTADIVTPNAFEAAHLTGIATTTSEGALAAARALRAAGPRTAVVTGVRTGDRSQTLAVSDSGALSVTVPWVERPSHGAGDLFAALLLGRLLQGAPLPDALSLAVSSVHAVLDRPPPGPERDIPLIAAQDVLLEPPTLFPAEALDV
jgi:pyridoxine kinase